MNIGNHYASWLKNSALAGYQNHSAKSGKTGKSDTSVTNNPDEEKEKTGAENRANMTYREQILAHMEEMAKKVKEGKVEPTFQTGAQSFTIKEWEKLIADFDDAEEGLQEQIKQLIAEVEAQAEKESLERQAQSGTADPGEVANVSVPTAAMPDAPAAGSVANPAGSTASSGTDGANTPSTGSIAMPAAEEATVAAPVAGSVSKEKEVKEENVSTQQVTDPEELASLLTDEVTKCSYPTDDPQKKHWYITCYGQDGIWCKEAYYEDGKWVNKDCWRFSYTEEGQYEKVMAFLQRFPQDANLRFASHENFWKDFLAGEIDEDDFVHFFETSTDKDGVPDYTYEKDGSTYIDREKIKYAKYMNDFGAKFYTAEEMELIQRAVMNENRKHLTKISDYDGQMTIPGGGSGKENEEGEEGDDNLKTQIITKPDGSTVLQIETNFGVMQVEVSEAKKFGLQYTARTGQALESDLSQIRAAAGMEQNG